MDRDRRLGSHEGDVANLWHTNRRCPPLENCLWALRRRYPALRLHALANDNCIGATSVRTRTIGHRVMFGAHEAMKSMMDFVRNDTPLWDLDRRTAIPSMNRKRAATAELRSFFLRYGLRIF